MISKLIILFPLFFSSSVSVAKDGSSKPIKGPLCSSISAKKAAVNRLNKIYEKNYLSFPILVRSQGKLWDVCAKRRLIPKKIVHVKIRKDSKNCEIKSIIHYEDAVVVNTGDTKSFLEMKQQIECNPEKHRQTNIINIETKHPYPFLQKDFSCKSYGLKKNSELCIKLKLYNSK